MLERTHSASEEIPRRRRGRLQQQLFDWHTLSFFALRLFEAIVYGAVDADRCALVPNNTHL
jgi:hypothetical protein